MNNLIFTKNSIFISGWTEQFWQNIFNSKVIESWNISTQIWQKFIFFQHTQPLYDFIQKNW